MKGVHEFARRILEGRSIPGRGMIREKSMNAQEINVQQTGNDSGRKPGREDEPNREGEGKQEGGANPFSAFSKGVPGAHQAVGKLWAWMGWGHRLSLRALCLPLAFFQEMSDTGLLRPAMVAVTFLLRVLSPMLLQALCRRKPQDKFIL